MGGFMSTSGALFGWLVGKGINQYRIAQPAEVKKEVQQSYTSTHLDPLLYPLLTLS